MTGYEKQELILQVMQEIITSVEDKYKIYTSYRSQGLFAEV